ncbi:MAG: hypothetical protein HY904_24710 [Deltaproteobacteria bacterium]|nr:hypothetical protein [Deltaproteobacteria bacterium]
MVSVAAPFVLWLVAAPGAGSSGPPPPVPDAGAAAVADKPRFPDGDVAVRAYPEPARVNLGDVFHLVVEVRHPAGHKVVLPESLTWGKLESAGPVQRAVEAEATRRGPDGKPRDSVVETFRFPLQAFQLEDVETPAMTLKIPGIDVADGALTIDALPVDVVRLGAADPKAEPAPMAPPVPIYREDPRFLAWPALLGWLALLWALVWWLDRRRPVEAVVARAAPPPPPVVPHRLALEKLEALRQSGLLERGKTAEFAEEAVQIAREYLEASYQVPVLEQTTEEALAALGPAAVRAVAQPDRRRLGRLSLDKVRAVLALADQVKFARGSVTVADCARLMEDVVHVVETTRPVGAAASTAMGADA